MKKILVVDDDLEIVTLTKKRLETCGYTVITASDGVQGLEKVNQDRPDLILLDLVMPIKDGLSMFSQLKNNDSTRRIPIIILTAKGETNSIAETQRLGVTEYFIKPYDWDKLLSCIKNYLE